MSEPNQTAIAGRVPLRCCRFPAKLLEEWQEAVKANKQRQRKLEFMAPWMPRSIYHMHCQWEPPHRVIPQQTTRFYTGWFLHRLMEQYPLFFAAIERYKLLKPLEESAPDQRFAVGNAEIARLSNGYFPGKLATLRELGSRLPFKTNNDSGLNAFKDPDVVVLKASPRSWGFYQIKNRAELNTIDQLQVDSLGLLKYVYGDDAEVAIVLLLEENDEVDFPSDYDYEFSLLPPGANR